MWTSLKALIHSPRWWCANQYTPQQVKGQGWQEAQRVLVTWPHDLSSVPGTPMVEGKNQLPQVVLWWPDMDHGMHDPPLSEGLVACVSRGAKQKDHHKFKASLPTQRDPASKTKPTITKKNYSIHVTFHLLKSYPLRPRFSTYSFLILFHTNFFLHGTFISICL